MGLRLRHNEWQRQLWKIVTHPITGLLALVGVVLLAVGTLVTTESQSFRGPHTPVIFSPK
jgi:hypothetical protein